MKAAGFCFRSLSPAFSRSRKCFGSDTYSGVVRRYILSEGTEETQGINEMTMEKTVKGICDYMETSEVKQRQFLNIGRLLESKFRTKLGESDLERVESHQLLGIYDHWDEYIHKNYFKLPGIESSMCVLMRLEGLVNSVLLFELRDLFKESAVKDNLSQVFEARRYKSKGVALFVDNLSQGSISLSRSKYSSEIRGVLQNTESNPRR
jgi:hypothetical protein